MSRNYLEFRAILRVSNGVFLRENEPGFVNFFLGEGPRPPTPPFHSALTLFELNE